MTCHVFWLSATHKISSIGRMKIIVFGPNGYLGQKFLELYPDAIPCSIDIADLTAVQAIFDEHEPDVVVNAAGKTGRPNIDWCEDHKAETLHANVTGPLVLVEECSKRNIYFVHMSSGCIFAGENEGRGFTETDEPNFYGSYYSRTKALADKLLIEFDNVLILRLRMPFDASMNERTLLAKLARYERVHDLPNSITYVPDFLRAAEALISKGATGIYHIVNPGVSSPYKIMQMYQEIVAPDHSVQLLSDDEVQTIQKAGRSNCLLNTQKLAEEGIVLLPVEQAIREALQKIAQNS